MNRHPLNPILSAKDIPYPATLIFNAGVCKWQGKYVMLFRNDYGSTEAEWRAAAAEGRPYPGFSTNLGIATSDDGIQWTPGPKPVWAVCDDEIRRVYDPRLTVVDGRVIVCFAMDTKHGLRGGIATTDDFEKFEIQSLSSPDNRNMVVFPERIGGNYVRLERPMPVYSRWGAPEQFDIWLSESPDLRYWGDTRLVLGAEQVPFAGSKIGPAAPPIRTPKGWLATFHAVRRSESSLRTWEKEWHKEYLAGLLLLDLDDPSKVIAMAKEPLLQAETQYELDGFRGSVIFPGGMILEDSGEVKIYYGAADTVECLATADLSELLGGLAPTSELALGAQNRRQAAAEKRLEGGPKGGPQVGPVLEAQASRCVQAAAGKGLEGGPQVSSVLEGGPKASSVLEAQASRCAPAAARKGLEGGPKGGPQVSSVLEAQASRNAPASRQAPRLPTIPSQLRRCRNWDYKGRAIYMITLTLRDRSRPLLGRLVIDGDGSGDPEAVRAHVEPTALGEAIAAHWKRIAEFTPQIKPLACQLMPEHFHGILFVREPMPKPLGQAIAGFKAGCTKIFREHCGPNAGPLWSEGFNDTILFAKGQLDRMFDYLADNPRRSAVKRLFPELLHVRREIRLPGVDAPVQAIGNADLLRRPVILQVQCSRRISAEDLAEKKAMLLAAARHGAVLVSPCISPGEKEIAQTAFDEGLPLITLLENGFPPLYKPSGKRFDACAAGKLLLVAPWPYHNEQRPITREQCLALNRLAAAIAAASRCGFAPTSELALGARNRGVP